jgi:FlaA1/EpsC-like NDP-sugar epimerase
VVAGAAQAFFFPPFRQIDFVVLILDNFFLASMVIGIRVSFRTLQYLSRQDPSEGKRVIIYGADVNGSLLLERMLESNIESWIPIGFIDDNPAMEGKFLNGYPVFGGHWHLHKLIRERQINEIVLCSETIQPEALKRVRKLAKECKVDLKKLRILYEDYHDEKDLRLTPSSKDFPGTLVPRDSAAVSGGHGVLSGTVVNGAMAKPNF